MPLHKDDPNRAGNLTDEQYEAVTRARMERVGDAGLHTIPPDVLEAATAAALARDEGEPG